MRTIAELSDLRGRVAAITGGGGHIGGAIAAGLAELGADVALLDLPSSRAREVANSLASQFGRRATAIELDLADEAQVRGIPGLVEAELGGLDILVHSAALVGTTPLEGWSVPVLDQSVATWRRALEINLTVPFLLTQVCAPLLAASGRGAVVFVSSIYAVVGPQPSLYEGTLLGNPAAYGASKAGLLQLTRHFATTLAPRIRFNAILPGGVARNQDPVFVERYEKLTPLGRMAVEEDLVGAAAYLASDLSRYVTGQALAVDGGWTAW